MTIYFPGYQTPSEMRSTFKIQSSLLREKIVHIRVHVG